MNKLFLSCKKASELIDRKLEDKLSLKDGIQLKMHLAMCKTCTAYEKQTSIISKGLKKYFHSEEKKEATIVKNDELKDRIISKL